MLVLISSTQASRDSAPTWISILILALALAAISISLFFVIRYQFRLFKNIENAMTRIADAVEAIAQHR